MKMKTVSINKRELVEAIGQDTHLGFGATGWSWQVVFDPQDSEAEAKVVLVNPDTDQEVNYRLVNEESYPVSQFVDLDDFVWGGDDESLANRTFDDVKDVETIRVPAATRQLIEGKLRKQVQIGKDTFKVEYF
jgi:hypothetical protein